MSHSRNDDRVKYKWVGLMVCWLGLVAGCPPENQYHAPPTPKVTIAQPHVQTVTDWYEFTGTTEASEFVEIRARVEGYLETVNFDAGALIKAGDLLFQIDPKPFEARLKESQARLESAQAAAKQAEHDYRRIEKLYKEQVAADTEFINAEAAWKSAQAAIKAAEAQVATAELNLGYTTIQSPIDGRVNRTLVDEGNLVGAGERTLLTTVVKDDPIYVYFSASETDLLNYLEMYPERRTSTKPEGNPVYMGLANEEGFPHEGQTNWAENRVDPDTGTIRVRGVFDNAKHMVLPGMFVRIRVPANTMEHALLVPETVVGSDMAGAFVYVVDAKSTVEKRYVKTGTLVDRKRVIKEGLAADEWIVVKGLQRAREGVTVDPVKEGVATPDPSEASGTAGDGASKPAGEAS